jgi:hypothetical protein
VEATMDFDKDERGNIVVFPLIAWKTTTALASCYLQLTYARSEEEALEGPGALPRLQIAMTPIECRALATSLLLISETLEQRPSIGDGAS